LAGYALGEEQREKKIQIMKLWLGIKVTTRTPIEKGRARGQSNN